MNHVIDRDNQRRMWAAPGALALSVVALLLLALPALALALAAAAAPAPKAGPPAPATVHFEGPAVSVPAGFRVVRLARDPRACVRLDRRVVYLGAPSPEQSCPAGAILGRKRAIVIEPPAASPLSGAALTAPAPRAHASGAPAHPSASGATFTGLGFDTCSAPSTKAMAAWLESPFRGVGVYIGGENSACSQPNLTAAWVSAETAAGWHLIPTYVGLQSPTSSCSSCAKLSPTQATAQGAAAAEDAVVEATAIAVGPGSPIYFDMESYTPTTSSTAATLAFLGAWTERLHTLGYVSGVYSSTGSGIADLAASYGTSYVSPDDIWLANWNNQQTTSDPAVPASAWPTHQRIHQFRGAHDDTYGGTTINVDSDYVDGATVGVATAPVGESDPVGELELTGAPAPGQLRVKGWAYDPEAPTEALSIAVYVGGRAGAPGAQAYELGPIANLPLAAVGRTHLEAGPNHGFDATVVSTRSGPQPVCVYALNLGAGENRLLGCKTTNIPVPITLSNLRATAHGVRVRITCTWPAGTACPGQLALRTRFRLATPRRHRPPLIHVVERSLGRRAFTLTGAHGHAFEVRLTPGAAALLSERGQLRTRLIVAIPGGRRSAVLPLRPAR
jgi:hypothetical protein